MMEAQIVTVLVTGALLVFLLKSPLHLPSVGECKAKQTGRNCVPD